MIIYKKVNLKMFNTLNLNAFAKIMFEVENAYEIFILNYLFNCFNIDFIVLGNGSKIVFKDKYVKKIIILINESFKEIYINKNEALVSSGYLLKNLIIKLKDNNLGGFESLFPIPGSVGGIITNNAGIKDLEIKDFVKKVICLNENNEILILNNKDIDFKYRYSIFKNKKYIILYVLFSLKEINKNEILNNIRNSIIYRKNYQELVKTCGSFFKNPANYKAYELIIKSKANKYKVNGAMVSKKHANILINKKYATGKDVIKLMHRIQKKVFKSFNIVLEAEIIIV